MIDSPPGNSPSSLPPAGEADPWPIIGHDLAVEGLRREVERGRLSHAYLFVGPPQVGKATLARIFAQAIFCAGDPAALGESRRPCGVCRPCRLIARGSYPDVEWFSLERQGAEAAQFGGPARANKELSIDTVRGLQRSLGMRPYEGEHRLAIVDDAERLSLPAANALLKTLEEPPPFAILVLLASDAADLLPTIVSRTQVVPLRPVARDIIAAALQAQHTLDHDRALLLASLSGGRPGWAIDRARNPALMEEREELIDILSQLPQAGLPARFNFAAELASRYPQNPAEVVDVLAALAGWWRDVLVLRHGVPDLVLNVDKRDMLLMASSRYDEESITSFLSAVEHTRRALAQNVSPRLALEALLMKMPQG